jgi:hypothetical protein
MDGGRRVLGRLKIGVGLGDTPNWRPTHQMLGGSGLFCPSSLLSLVVPAHFFS